MAKNVIGNSLKLKYKLLTTNSAVHASTFAGTGTHVIITPFSRGKMIVLKIR